MPNPKLTFLAGAVAAVYGSTAAGEEQTVDPEARQAYITGKPPRIAPLEPAEYDEGMRALIRSMGQLGPTAAADGRASADGDPAQEPEVSEMLATLGRHPELYGYHLDLARLLFQGELSPRDRELAILRVAWLLQAPYEWGEHVWIAKTHGVTEDMIERVMRGSSADGWSERDRAIVRGVEELIQGAMIRDETWSVLAGEFDEKQLIEFVFLVGQYQTVAYYQNALRLQLRDGNQGLAAR